METKRSADRQGAGLSLGQRLKKIRNVLGISALLYVVLFGAYSYFQFGSTKGKLLQFGLSEATSHLLAIAVMLIAIAIPLLAVVRILAMRGRTIDYGMVMVLPLISWLIQQIPAKFDSTTGVALKYCANRPNGEKFCLDREGFDPQTGMKLMPVTPEAVAEDAIRVNNLQARRIEVPFEEIVFFDVVNGDPLVWVYPTSDGCFESFSNAGVHPTEGVALIPVTRELVSGMRTCLSTLEEQATQARAEKIAAERKAEDERKRQAELAAERNAQQRAEAERQALVERETAYRSRYAVHGATKTAYGFAISDGSQIISSLTANLASLIDGSRKDSVLRTAAVQDGVFEKVFQGDTDEFRKLQLDAIADRIVLAIVNVDYSENTQIRGTTNAHVTLSLRVFEASSGTTINATSQAKSALDYSRDGAFNKAFDSIIETVAAEL